MNLEREIEPSDDVDGIAQIQCLDPRGGEASRGSGFLIAPCHVITALHVVGRVEEGRVVAHGDIVIRFVGHRRLRPGGSNPGPVRSIEIEQFDEAGDWALLRCSAPIDLPPLRVLLERDEELDSRACWSSFGFPKSAASVGKWCGGETRGMIPAARPGDVDLLQLFSEEAAAGLGEFVAGYSGGPILVAGGVVAIMRSAEKNNESMAVVQSAAGAVARGNVIAGAGTLYATPIGRVIEAAQALASVAGPSWLVPSLGDLALPPEPFRDLLPYTELDARIFFGRERAIREVYLRLTGDGFPPVLMLYGQAGVGKSSLLAAGVFPRLRSRCAVRLRKRDAEGLRATLSKALERRPDETVAAAWARCAREEGHELIVILDQAEEAFTLRATKEEAAREVHELLRDAHELFGAPDSPRGRLVLSYRKEWHAEFDALRRGQALRVEKYWLKSMGHDEAERALASTFKMLTEHYGATVDPGLLNGILNFLAGDRDSALAPVLQVLLTRLWRDATANGGASLTLSRFEQMKKEGLGLREFLDNKLREVGLDVTLRPHIDSGLALDLLRFHTTELATSAERTTQAIDDRYRGRDGVVPLVAALRRVALLTDGSGDGRGSSRLVHDALGPIVHSTYARSVQPGPRALRRLESRIGEHSPGGGDREGLFSAAELAVIGAGLPGMRAVTGDEADFLFRSALQHPSADHEFWERLFERVTGGQALDRLLVLVRDVDPESQVRAALAIPRSRLRTELEPDLVALSLSEHESVHLAAAEGIVKLATASSSLRALVVKAARSNTRRSTAGRRALDVVGDLMAARVPLQDVPLLLARRARDSGARRYFEKRGAAATVDLVVVAEKCALLVGAWLIALLPLIIWRAKETILDQLYPLIGNMMPIGIWVFLTSIVSGTATRRFASGGLLWLKPSSLWRSLVEERLAVPMIVANALTTAFVKIGVYLIDTGRGLTQREINAIPILDEVAFATAFSALAYGALLANSFLLVRASRPAIGTRGRYGLVVASTLGIPILFPTLLMLALPMFGTDTLFRYRLLPHVIAGLWMETVCWLGALNLAVAWGLLDASRAAPAAVEAKPRGVIWGRVAVGVLAFMGLTTAFVQFGWMDRRTPLPILTASARNRAPQLCAIGGTRVTTATTSRLVRGVWVKGGFRREVLPACPLW